MTNISPTLQDVQNKAEQTVHHAKPWVEGLARAGYAAKGIVYMIIGVLAVQAAITGSGKTTGNEGALTALAQSGFGRAMLILLGIGLAGYSLWRFVQATLDVDNEGKDAKGVATRVGFFLSASVYAALAYSAYELLTGTKQGDGGNAYADWTARIFALPFGQMLVGLGGLIAIGLGIAQIVRGWKTDFTKQLKVNEIAPAWRNAAITSGRVGYIARGVVFFIVGGFILNAALKADPQKAKGLGSALDLLAQQSYGTLVLGIVAAGLVLYGIFMLVEARYRRISV
jgi:hypothetical protein